MKTLYSFLISFFCFVQVYGQSISHRAIPSAGVATQAGGIHYSYSIGLPLSSSILSNGLWITQGFQQPVMVYFRDQDGDGLGDKNQMLLDFLQPTGFVSDSTDCDDSNASVGAILTAQIWPQDTLRYCSLSQSLQAPGGYSAYVWGNGDTNSIITASQSGWYRLRMQNSGGCWLQDSVYIDLFQAQITQNDTTLCAGASLRLSATATGVSGSSSLPTNLRQGLVGYWPFNGNANDESGNGNHGAVNGSSLTIDRFGNQNKAYNFNGSSNYIDVGTLPTLGNNPSALTQNAWVLAATNQSNYCKMPLISKRHSGNNSWATLGAGGNGTVGVPWNNQAYFFVNGPNYSAGITNALYSNNVTNDGQWHMLTGTKNGSTYKLYFDGILQDSIIDNYSVGSNDNMIFGHESIWGFSCEQWYAGKLDDIGIWNRALTPQEIQQLYRGTNTTYLWSTGDTTATINVNPTQTTTYYCTISNGITTCVDSVKVTVNALPSNFFAQDTIRQCGSSYMVQAPSGYSYSWNTGETTSSITAIQSGWYRCTINNGTCNSTDSVFVSLINAQITQNDTSICEGTILSLSATANGVSGGSSLPANLRQGLVGYWPFNGNANDESGNGNHGTVTGATLTSDRNGNSYEAYSFDGNNDFIQITNSASLNFNQGTINIWFSTAQTNFMNLIERNIFSNASNENWALAINQTTSGNLSLYTKHNSNCLAGNGWQTNLVNQSPLLNNWHMLTGMIKNNTTEIYLDGFMVNTLNTLTLMDICGGDIQIARHWLNDPRYFSGKLDDIGIWNRALTPQEIQQLYRGTNTTYLWSTGDTTATINVNPTQTTTYYCTISNGITTCVDSVKVTVNALPSNFFAQDTIRQCGSSYMVQAPSGYSYSWNTGETTSSITAIQSGWYRCTINNGTCNSTDSVFVSLINAQITQNDTSICEGTILSLSATANGVSGGSSLPANLRQGLVGYWPFNGNANDESGNGNHGTVTGATLTSDRNGNSYEAYSFDGNNDFIQITNSASLNFNQGTINIWFSTAQTNFMNLIERNIFSNASNENWALAINQTTSGNLSLYTKHNSNCLAGNGWQTNLVNQSPLLNNWHMLTGMIKNNTTEIYLDGFMVNTLNTLTLMDICGGDIQIARHWLNDPRYFSGKLDDIGIWNRALTPQEIQQLYRGTNTTYLWSTGDTTATISVNPTQTTTYYCTISNGITICVDSVKVTVLPKSTTNQSASICQGQTYTFGAQTLATAGTYTRTLTNSTGCDSVITLTLNVNQPSSSSITASICQGQTYTFGAQTLSIAGTYTRTLMNASGCDSVITLTLNVSQPSSSSITASICQGQTYTFGAQTLSTAGTYTRTLTNASGCDSVITLTLNVNQPSGSSITASICQGQTYTFGAQTLATAGTYTRTLTNASGCDSLITLTLYVNQPSGSSITASICQGQTYTFGAQTLSTAGTYTRTLTNASGCDSVVTLTLNVNQPSSSSITASICQGQTYTFGAQTLSTAGTYTRTLTNASGCDSVITLTFNVNQPSSSSITASICQGQTYTFGAQTLSTAGTYTRTLTNTSGCDSVITLSLNVNQPSSSSITASICQGQTYTFGAQTLSTAGTYTRTLTNASGCDSVITLTLSIKSSTLQLNILDSTYCPGDSLRFTASLIGGIQPVSYRLWRNNQLVLTSTDSFLTTAPQNSGDQFRVQAIFENACGQTDSLWSGSISVQQRANCGPAVSAINQTTICQSSNVGITIATLGTVFNPGNVFTVQISNSSGSFANPSNVGTLTGTQGGTVTVFLNSNFQPGAGYRFRIVSSSPALVGPVSSSALQIVPRPNISTVFITPSTGVQFCSGDSVRLQVQQVSGYNYAWQRDQTFITGANQSSHFAKIGGSYRVIVSAGTGCVVATTPVTVTQLPTPAIAIQQHAGGSLCTGDSITLSTSSSTTGLSLQWTRDGQVLANSQQSVLVIKQSGTYRLLATNAQGCSSLSNAIVLNFQTPVQPIASLSSNVSSICAGEQVTLTASGLQVGTAPEFHFLRNGQVVQSGSNAQHTAQNIQTADQWRVVVVATPGSCVTKSMDTSSVLTIVVQPRAVAQVSLNSSSFNICQGSPVTLTAQITNPGSQAVVAFLVNGQVVQSGSSLTYSSTNLLPGQSLQARVTISGVGCIDTTPVLSNTITLGLGANCGPSVSSISHQNLCQSSNLTVNIATGGVPFQSNNVFTLQMSNSSGSFATPRNLGTLSGSTGGNLTVFLNSNIPAGSGYRFRVLSSHPILTGPVSVAELNINPNPTAAQMAITPTGNSTLCSGGTRTLAVASTPGFTYGWQRNITFVPSGSGTTYQANASGTYRVVVTTDRGCALTSPTVTLNEVPNPTVSIAATTSTTLCGNDTGRIALTSSSAGLTFQWTLNQQAISGQTGTTLATQASGQYRLIATNGQGCSTTSAPVSMNFTTPMTPLVSLQASSLNLCQSDTLRVTATPQTNASQQSYTWLLNQQVVQTTTQPNFTFSGLSAGTQQISVRMTSIGGCVSQPVVQSSHLAVQVNSNVQPTVIIAGGDTASTCQGNALNFATIVTNGGAQPTYRFLVNGQQVQSGNSSLFSYSNWNHGDSLQVRMTSGLQCALPREVSSNVVRIRVQNRVNPVVSVQLSQSSVCGEEGLWLKGLTSTIYPGSSWDFEVAGRRLQTQGPDSIWVNSLDSLLNAGQATLTVPVTATYQIAGSNHCIVSNAVNATPVNLQVNARPNLSLSGLLDETICNNDTLVLTALDSRNLSPMSGWMWLNNGNVMNGVASASTLTITASGDYQVIGTTATGCSDTSEVKRYTFVDCSPVINSTPASLCIPSTLSYSANLPVYNRSGQQAYLELLLSDSSGNFQMASVVDSGQIALNGAMLPISRTATIPSGLASATGYRLQLRLSRMNRTESSQPTTVRLWESMPQSLPLCYVTSNSQGHAQLQWPITPAYRMADTIHIYKEGFLSGDFRKIGSVNYLQPAGFTDLQADLGERAQAYRITASNACGTTAPSTPHTTMHLSINQGNQPQRWNLIWNGYEGLPHRMYYLYRGTQSSNMVLIDSVPARSFNSYTDDAPLAQGYQYQVAVADAAPCQQMLRTTNVLQAPIRSNIVNNGLGRFSAKSGLRLELWPNPQTTGQRSQLMLLGGVEGEVYRMRIYNAQGQQLREEFLQNEVSTELESPLAAGMYWIRVMGKDGSEAMAKWVIQR